MVGFASADVSKALLQIGVRQVIAEWECCLTVGVIASTSGDMSATWPQIGVRQVIAGWDEGILGDGKDVPPMKVRHIHTILLVLLPISVHVCACQEIRQNNIASV